MLLLENGDFREFIGLLNSHRAKLISEWFNLEIKEERSHSPRGQ